MTTPLSNDLQAALRELWLPHFRWNDRQVWDYLVDLAAFEAKWRAEIEIISQEPRYIDSILQLANQFGCNAAAKYQAGGV